MSDALIPPWQCPECRIWLAPGTQSHSCTGAIPTLNGASGGANHGASPPDVGAIVGAIPEAVGANAEIAQEVLGSKVQGPAPKGRGYNEGYDPRFVEFWKVYPLRRDKRKAYKAWRNALFRVAHSEIDAGAIRYRDDVNRVAQFTKYAEGWLNADGWEDDPLPARIASASELAQRRESEAEADRRSRVAEAVAMAESTRGQA